MFIELKGDIILNLDKIHVIEFYEKDCVEGTHAMKKPYTICFCGDKEMHSLDYATKEERQIAWKQIAGMLSAQKVG